MPMLECCFSKDASSSMRIAGGDMVGPFESRDAVMGLMISSMSEQTDVRRHLISNMFFDNTNTETKVISNLTLMATDKGELQALTTGVYYDSVIEEAGNWCILKRHIDLDKAY